MVSSLLKDGRTYASGIYGEDGKPHDAFMVLEDERKPFRHKLDFRK